MEREAITVILKKVHRMGVKLAELPDDGEYLLQADKSEERTESELTDAILALQSKKERAADEIYEALKDAHKFIDVHLGGAMGIRDKIEVALAKARGK